MFGHVFGLGNSKGGSGGSSGAGVKLLGEPFSRLRRAQDRSISLSPAEREGKYQRNPGELAVGNTVELKAEFDRVKNLFISLPDQLAELPKINPCGMCAHVGPRLTIYIHTIIAGLLDPASPHSMHVSRCTLYELLSRCTNFQLFDHFNV